MKTKLIAVLFAVATLLSPAFAARGNAPTLPICRHCAPRCGRTRKRSLHRRWNLTPAEANKFWPIYDAYQRDLDLANQRRNVVVVDVVGLNKPLTDLYAKNLVNELMAADEAEIKARRSIQNKVLRALPDKKAARYLQLESKIRAYSGLRYCSGYPVG